MVTPEEIRKKALAKYPSFLRYEFISKEEEFFPLVIRCDKSIDFASLKDALKNEKFDIIYEAGYTRNIYFARWI